MFEALGSFCLLQSFLLRLLFPLHSDTKVAQFELRAVQHRNRRRPFLGDMVVGGGQLSQLRGGEPCGLEGYSIQAACR